MNLKSAAPSNAQPAANAKPQEKILFEVKQMLLPTILNIEILTMLGFTIVILLAAVVFRFGAWEFVIIGILYLLLAFPSFMAIFRAGSTTYVLTNQRLVIFSVGFGPRERSIPLDQIVDAKCKSSGLQRFYDAGDVVIYQKGLRKAVKMIGLRNCKGLAQQIQQAAKQSHSQAR